MADRRPPGSLGLDMRSPEPRRCGVCGAFGSMSKAHVPPRSAGNRDKVVAAIVRIDNGVRKPGRTAAGGMWLRGLCGRCNSYAGLHYDPAYADFAARLMTHLNVASRLSLLRPWEPPAVSVAPGRVVRSILTGLLAVGPQLRTTFPELAEGLRTNDPHLRMPDGLTLRYALYPERSTRLAGPIGAHRVLNRRESFETFAEVFFRPLAWVLAPTRATVAPSVLDSQGWANADEWPLYGPDVERLDLRYLTRRLPIVRHPVARAHDEWVEMWADEITPVLEGYIPP